MNNNWGDLVQGIIRAGNEIADEEVLAERARWQPLLIAAKLLVACLEREEEEERGEGIPRDSYAEQLRAAIEAVERGA